MGTGDSFDIDRDGVVTDAELATAERRPLWRRLGLHGPAIVLRWFGRNAKRMAVLLLGCAVLAAGAAMLVLPGPGVIIIIVGLAILATEFAWAERALDRTRSRATNAIVAVQENAAGRWLLVLSGLGLVAGGVIALVVLPSLAVAAVSLALAGAIALGTLLPAVQRWLRQSTDSRVDAAEAAD
jgi:uncharacterized protein (TIGR02611 family)